MSTEHLNTELLTSENMNAEQLFDNKYKVIRVLGQGGMSKVFLAENIKLNTLWAIKEIKKDKNQHVDLLAEPNALKKLRHPSLPRIFDIIENEEYIYIVQDYIEGTDVSKLVMEHRTIEEDRVLKWAKQIADVFIYLHNLKPNPMIYRDMKPGNLIVDHDDNIKVIDFGIAREYKEGSTEDTTMLGTRGYAAPEQYGTSQTDRRTDLYSLGITLYHILTGIGPSDPTFDTRTLEKETHVSSGMANVLKKCVEPNPANRFQSAEDFKEALDNIHEWNASFKLTTKQKKALNVTSTVLAVIAVLLTGIFTLKLKVAMTEQLPLLKSVIGLLVGVLTGVAGWYTFNKGQSLSLHKEDSNTDGNSTSFSKLKVKTKPVIAFFSPRSTGKTEIACNTALALSKMGKKVILLDLDHTTYGTIYNFPVDPGEDYENYHKFRVLVRRITQYIKGDTAELTAKEVDELALHSQKNLKIFSGNQEIELNSDFGAKGLEKKQRIESELMKTDLSKKWISKFKDTYECTHTEPELETIQYLIRKLTSLSDVLIIDVGKQLDKEIVKQLTRNDSVAKNLVTTENLEDLNSIAHLMRFEQDVDYEGWNVIVNKTTSKPMFSIKELKKYFYDHDVDFLNFKVRNIVHIPYVEETWKFKKKRKCILGYSKYFDSAIEKLITISE